MCVGDEVPSDARLDSMCVLGLHHLQSLDLWFSVVSSLWEVAPPPPLGCALMSSVGVCLGVFAVLWFVPCITIGTYVVFLWLLVEL